MRGLQEQLQPVQFTQRDPIGLAGGINQYGYAGGDPVNFSDPFGLCRQRSGLLGAIVNLFAKECATVAEAADRGMEKTFDRSVKDNVEYGGEIVSVRGGFRYTQRRGTVDGVDINETARGYEAAWHTHGGPDPDYDGESFSDDDKVKSFRTGKPVYVVTPSGQKKRYDSHPGRPLDGTETDVGQIRRP